MRRDFPPQFFKLQILQCSRRSQHLKITQKSHFKGSFLILAFSINFCLVTLFDRKLQVFKYSTQLIFLAFLMNFCLLKLKLLNATFPVIFKHREKEDPMFSLKKMHFCTCTFVNLGMNCNFGPAVHGLHNRMLKAFFKVQENSRPKIRGLYA